MGLWLMTASTAVCRCPDESPALQDMGTVPAMATGAFAPPLPDVCTAMSYQYDCVVGTAHMGTVCVPLCPSSAGSPPCIPCEDVRANCAWVRATTSLETPHHARWFGD
jgi:hypothetical protein